MSVHVILSGRLGNNLFQYAFGRIIAEHHGFALTCEQRAVQAHEFLDRPLARDPSATLTALASYFPEAPLAIAGRSYARPVQAFEVRPGGRWGGQTVDLSAILADPTPRHIRLMGFFQRFAYYAPYRQTIRRWYTPTPIATPHPITARDVVVSIRRDADYGVRQWALSLDYYVRVLSAMTDRGQVYVCGTGIDDDLRRRLASFDPIEYDGSPIAQFCFLTRFNRLVLSNSTFAWWAAFVSRATEVYAPRSPNGVAYGFTGYRDVDLQTGEPNYIEVRDAGISEFGIVTAGPATLARLAPSAGAIATTLGRAERDACFGDLDTVPRELLVWVLGVSGPVTLATIRRRYGLGNAEAAGAFRALVQQGWLAVDERYLR